MFKESKNNIDWDEILKNITNQSNSNDFLNTWDFLVSDNISLESQLEVQIEARDILYTTLLEDYRNITRKRNSKKERYKWIFFWLIVVAAAYVNVCFGLAIFRVLLIEDVEMLISAIPVLITAFVALLSSIVTIPLTITRFLFNEKEDDNITKTIHKTQQHDKSQIASLLNLKHLILDPSNKCQSSNHVDPDVELGGDPNDVNSTEKKGSDEEKESTEERPIATDSPLESDILPKSDDLDEEFSSKI